VPAAVLQGNVAKFAITGFSTGSRRGAPHTFRNCQTVDVSAAEPRELPGD
jgi:hypothetical protein